ncbi:MAG TPA: type II toxin-antitoxin system RelE/ParE family toxin [Candidatus Sulfotelmatobacter sp.]|nr:type II toxin-antitoxin system RelE/ParE family toxin [Candidatus Sulfotelmatobacter sp.]
MIEQVIFTAGADDDIAEAYHWFESREPGLGESFLRCVEARILMIRRQPKIYRVAVDDFRRAFVRRFPYENFYEATEKAIIIYSVFHCSQNPKKWHKRLLR